MEGFLQSKSKTFLAFCFCFVCGSAFFSYFDGWERNIFFFPACFFLFLFPFFWKSITIRFILICAALFLLSGIRLSFLRPEKNENSLTFYAGQKLIVHGVVSQEPDVRIDGVRYVVKSLDQQKQGNVYVKSGLYPRFSYGDLVTMNCGLKTPEPIEDFHYEKYLALMRVFVLCQAQDIEKKESGKGNIFFSFLFRSKSKIAHQIEQLWPEPYASFVAGILYGYRGGLGSLQELFNRTGVTHIVAISGYNITLIATLVARFFLSCGVSRKKAFWGIVGALFVFVIFVGASASVVRAGIMGVLVLSAQYLGRKSHVFSVIVAAMTLMALQNPYVILWDAGFQLSVLSTLGLIYVSPFIEPKLSLVPERFSIRENLSSTLAATVATLPLILFQFGRLSIVAPLVNVLILPIIPIAMIGGFFSVLFSFISFSLGKLLSFFTYLTLLYGVSVVRFFASFPFASVELHIPWWGMVGSYILIIWLLWKKK